ncbi:MAG: hypothetical protein MUF07_00645 [Steroidobacteraceae bacterium]|jgi:hypothetical protein|nr:hypothetical protein [Steroidobacteraceae bacterium]
MWRGLRVAVLLAVLVVVAGGAWVDRRRTTDWDSTLWIGIFPIAADARAVTREHVAGLRPGTFTDIERFFEREARAHGVTLARPIKVELNPPLAEAPPRLDPDAGVAGRILWSLRMRAYAWRQARGSLADISMFVLYHDPTLTPAVPHSLGLQKGLLGVVYAFADPEMDGSNAVVIAHEAMHALGATDKYDPASGLPRFPDGYADPDAEPRHPQQDAEIMGGRIALAPDEAEVPESLDDVVVGALTAAEINWPGRR